MLQEVFPDSIWLEPDPARGFFWAVFADGVGAVLFDWPDSTHLFPVVEKSACMVAGVGFRTHRLALAA